MDARVNKGCDECTQRRGALTLRIYSSAYFPEWEITVLHVGDHQRRKNGGP
jgi:hypothetical protein